MFEDRRVLRAFAALGAGIAIFATFLPWYSFDVVLPAAGSVHIFAVTTTLWGLTTVAPILIVVGALVALIFIVAAEGPLSGVVTGSIGLAITIYALVRCFDVPDLGVQGVPPGTNGAIRAITSVEGGTFIELSAGFMLVAGAVGNLLPSLARPEGPGRSSHGGLRPGASMPPGQAAR
jgi:hypothetical protein